MRAWIYKWLPILFGCHHRPERSFFYKGTQFPLCARCTGELLGIILGICGYGFIHPKPVTAALLLLPLIVDGTVQALTSYTSTNGRRLLTGLLFGYGLITLFLFSVVQAFLFGYYLLDT